MEYLPRTARLFVASFLHQIVVIHFKIDRVAKPITKELYVVCPLKFQSLRIQKRHSNVNMCTKK